MLKSIIFLFVVVSSELSSAKQIDVIKLPFVINSRGEMILTDVTEKFSLDDKLMLTHKDQFCLTKLDFSRPNAKEAADKKGFRTMTEDCKELPEPAKKGKQAQKGSKKA
uniref:Uncharacterized protein n=1 Tax=Trichobilharzia regenti TaxID=157069 RepID=A0AA85KIS1_TRIRE|nr:unnamed protein product [Trichobilharzia regenti]